MARTKQTVRMSIGGKAPRKQLAPKATRKLLATRKPGALPDLQNLQEFNEAYNEGKEIEKRMEVFAAKPSRKLYLEDKVGAMEDQVEAYEAELKRMKSALETARSELEKEEAAERQDKEDAVRLEVVRATIEKAGKGLVKELETKIGKSSESEGESGGGAEECDDCGCGSMAGSVDPDRGELSSTDDLGGQTDFDEARMSVPPENELSVVQDKAEEETEN